MGKGDHVDSLHDSLFHDHLFPFCPIMADYRVDWRSKALSAPTCPHWSNPGQF